MKNRGDGHGFDRFRYNGELESLRTAALLAAGTGFSRFVFLLIARAEKGYDLDGGFDSFMTTKLCISARHYLRSACGRISAGSGEDNPIRESGPLHRPGPRLPPAPGSPDRCREEPQLPDPWRT